MSSKYFIILPAAALLCAALASCSKDDPAGIPQPDSTQTFSITVTDSGFGSLTRATENGYATAFTAGDACGLYIVRDGALVYENVKLTATDSGTGSLTWEPAETLAGGLAGESYFLYYPYQEIMTDLTDATLSDADAATDDAAFFAPLIASWTPQADQSDYATGYTASDLMTATGTATTAAGTITLAFSMTHQMALAAIEFPEITYEFTDNTIPDYTTLMSANFSSDATPYRTSDGLYRYLINPASPATISGSYGDEPKQYSFTVSGIEAGQYKTYKVDGGGTTTKTTSYTLQVGDYFCKDSSSDWYIIPSHEDPNSECVGVVFYVGHNTNDNSDYSSTGIGQKQCRGYAVALEDAYESSCLWGSNGVELGNYVTNNYADPGIDWSGYNYTQNMISAAGGKTKLNASEASGYPAAYYTVVAYENKVSAPSGTSGWFLPAVGQLLEVNNQFCLDTSVSVFTPAGGTDLCSYYSYWSSSEIAGWQATTVMDVLIGRNYRGMPGKGESRYVRSILAF